MLLAVAGVMGFLSVALGAYAEHGLREAVTEEVFRFLMTAIRYAQVHALAVLGVGVALLRVAPERRNGLLVAGWGFVAGTAFFSGGIYLAALLDAPILNNLAPIGGVTLMAAWLCLAATGWMAQHEAQDAEHPAADPV